MEELRLFGLKALEYEWRGNGVQLRSPSYKEDIPFAWRGSAVEKEARCWSRRPTLITFSSTQITSQPVNMEDARIGHQDPPEENCLCGIHASWSIDPVIEFIYPDPLKIYVIALMEGWGKIAVHENGWRARHAIVKGIAGLFCLDRQAGIILRDRIVPAPGGISDAVMRKTLGINFGVGNSYGHRIKRSIFQSIDEYTHETRMIADHIGVDCISWADAEKLIHKSKWDYLQWEAEKNVEAISNLQNSISSFRKRLGNMIISLDIQGKGKIEVNEGDEQ